MPVTTAIYPPESGLAEASCGDAQALAGAVPACFHCGTPCDRVLVRLGDKAFCCRGCQTVFELLNENGLGHFYDLGKQAGIRVNQAARHDQYAHLDDPAVRERLLDFTDGKSARITFRVPALHCIACVWLLENLFRLHPGIGGSRANFPKKEVTITFDPAKVTLSDLATLLDSIGYEPELRLSDLEDRAKPSVHRRLYLQVGLAGFAFGNIMLFSFPSYLGLGGAEESGIKHLFGWLSLIMALPVLLYSAADYWRSAWLAVRQRVLTIDLPIAVGLLAIYTQSAWEVLSGRGEGYLDSLTGLIFFLLIGKVFQQKTYDRLVFDRDYKSFFPLSVKRLGDAGEETVPLSQVRVGDRIILRHGDLIPADARLAGGKGLVDYSFVTGESDPVEKSVGDYLYAGGQQLGGAIEVEIQKPVSQSYLTSLWSHETFAKKRPDRLHTLTNQFSRRFTIIVAGVALGAAVFWGIFNPSLALKAFVSVLIVACPCALALAAPFALGTAQRLLAGRGIFLKSPLVIERLARIDTVVFDKTGTLTLAGAGGVAFQGAPLSETEQQWVRALARHSTHPLCLRISAALADQPAIAAPENFRETPGGGVAGNVEGREILLGNPTWLTAQGVAMPGESQSAGTAVHVAIDGHYRGHYRVASVLRPQTRDLVRRLAERHELALLSGDNERERERFRDIFGHDASLHFNQSPLHKLEFIQGLQQSGQNVMMVGDGLNDAGALKQSDVGVAVVENVGRFSPASDVIIDAPMVPTLSRVIEFSRLTVRIVLLSFGISSLYNIIGVSIAASGRLSPLVCAVLMPLSSITVVAFACGATRWAARKSGLTLPGNSVSSAQPEGREA